MGVVIYLVVCLLIAVVFGADLGVTGGGTFALFLAVAVGFPIVVGFIVSFGEAEENKRIIAEVSARKARENELKALRERYETALKQIYLPKPVPSAKMSFSSPHPEINSCVSQLRQELEHSADTLQSKRNTLKETLDLCLAPSDDQEKQALFEQHRETLDTLTDKITSISRSMESSRIVLRETGESTVRALESALREAGESQKVQFTVGSSFSGLLPETIPEDLQLFRIPYPPLVLRFSDSASRGTRIYCVFQNSILAFNGGGAFLGACSSREMELSLRRAQEMATTENGRFDSAHTAQDSRQIAVLETNSTWQHIRMDGLPDLRYSYNPRIVRQTLRCEYGSVTISIGDNQVKFTFSSAQALQDLEQAITAYQSAPLEECRPVGSVVQLLTSVEPNNPAVRELKDCYEQSDRRTERYCYIERE